MNHELVLAFYFFRNGSVLCASPLERATRCCLQTLVVVWLSFFFLLTPDTSRVPTEAREHAARQRDNFNAPRLWLKQRACAPKREGGRLQA